MPATAEERSPEETKRVARLAGAVYVSLGLAAALGFYHAPLVQGDLGAIAHGLTKSDLRFRIGVVSDVLSTALSVPLALLLYQLLKPVHKMQAVLMALLLVVAMPISFFVACWASYSSSRAWPTSRIASSRCCWMGHASSCTSG